ncbi:hypothetical protein BZARG_2553 [Bizionia argentinensis JUB59]|uniref:DUF3558 domain-containing protein n=1 Tax=Bizionia argentinensis JUB59 TaxID=1046627 RepID=G2EGT6_9FLAO|nr:hypothetical protein [Bizionia argentinensis]EGV42319.1 hypothetical protein BZARG_2553 [Bizionia argentinensis JUB59]
MKTISKLPKATYLLLFLFLISVATSCKKEEKNKGSYFGSSQREDISKLITKEDIRSIFELDNDHEIEHKEKKSAISSFDWEMPSDKKLFYSVKLNFARGDRRSSSVIDKIWEGQSKSVYQEKGLQEVSDVGDKASWSTMAGGQLRVTADGYLFFVSFFVNPKKDNPLSKDEMIDKASALAKQVIKRM